MRFLLSMLMAFVTLTLAPAQDPVQLRIEAKAPVLSQVWDADAIFSVHADGSTTLAAAVEGSLVASFYSLGEQGPIGGAKVPVLESSWCDAQGVTHKVTTPIDSSTEAGVDRAIALHQRLVTRMQTLHPPRPCPPPAPV